MDHAANSLPDGWGPMLDQVQRTLEEAMAATVMREETLSSWANETDKNKQVVAEALSESSAAVWPPQVEAVERCFQDLDQELQGGENSLQEYSSRLSQLRQEWQRWLEKVKP